MTSRLPVAPPSGLSPLELVACGGIAVVLAVAAVAALILMLPLILVASFVSLAGPE